MRPAWLALLAVPPLLDTAFRSILACASRRSRRASPEEARWLVLVPAREEGRAVEPTLVSILAAGTGHDVRTVLVLDGDDAAAAAVAARLGIGVRVKTPAGPSKAAVLAWCARELESDLGSRDAVLVLDVGSLVSEDFFSGSWPRGADAAQAFLRGGGDGPGRAIALSERRAQEREDLGREALGWAVRLRGTGTALTPAAFRSIMPQLRTKVEDLEASLLLAASGARVVMMPPRAWVGDEKPERVVVAAGQRARWLAGRIQVLGLRARALMRLAWERPLEGVAFGAELLGRPLSLTALARMIVAAVLAGTAVSGSGGMAEVALAALLVATVAADAALVGAGDAVSSAWSLLVSWLAALALLPRAFLGWIRGRRS
ncbi:MAG: glycosyltransferase [Acidobacteriota bacterium]